METAATKVCDTCHKELPLTEFHRNKRNPDGLQNTCKACKNEWMREYNNRKRARKQEDVQHVVNTESPTIFSKMQQREIIAEIRERINYLRSVGWVYEEKLTYTEIKEVKL